MFAFFTFAASGSVFSRNFLHPDPKNVPGLATCFGNVSITHSKDK